VVEGQGQARRGDRIGLGQERNRLRRPGRENNIAVTADVDDLAAMQAMLASPPPEVAASMEAHGVVPPITAYIEA